MNRNELITIQNIITPLIGLKAWGVNLGQGSFITLEFGNALPPDERTKIQHGEWHLWIYNSSWRLENGEKVLVGSEDSRQEINKNIRILEGLVLKNISFLAPGPDTVLEFENSIRLKVFPLIFHEENDYWILYMPDGKTLTLHTGPSWIHETG
jgi:hypothetical protein